MIHFPAYASEVSISVRVPDDGSCFLGCPNDLNQSVMHDLDLATTEPLVGRWVVDLTSDHIEAIGELLPFFGLCPWHPQRSTTSRSTRTSRKLARKIGGVGGSGHFDVRLLVTASQPVCLDVRLNMPISHRQVSHRSPATIRPIGRLSRHPNREWWRRHLCW